MENKDFKEILITNIIPSVIEMKDKEFKHMHWLIEQKAPIEFIQLSQKYYNHFVKRIEEYKDYAEKI